MSIAKRTTYRLNLDIEDAEIRKESEINYDRKGQVVKQVLFDPLGNVIRRSEYMAIDENRAREIHFDASGQQLMVKQLEFQDGKVSHIEVSGKQSATIKYHYSDNGEYDEITTVNGQQKQQKHWDSQDKLLWEVNLVNGYRTDYAYDDRGNPSEIREQHAEGHTTLSYRNEYSKTGNLEKLFINNLLSSEFFYRDGRCVKEIQYSLTGEPEVEVTHQYEFY